MKIKFAIFLFLTVFCNSSLFAQQKKAVKKTAPKQKSNLVVAEVLDTIDTQPIYDWVIDSVKFTKEDSMRYIEDSICRELENKERSRILDEKWYPKDSLSYVDRIVFDLVKKNDTAHLATVIDLITSRFKTSLQKARAIFSWVAATVKYDYETFSNNQVKPILDDDADAEETFQKKKGVCQNYANLYKYMCEKAGVECEVIVGDGKNFPFAINAGAYPNHAWNAVKTGNKWMLVDVTWANIDDSNRVDTYWFNTLPGQFIYSHFPKDSSWQLLTDKVSKKQFNDNPIVSSFLFKSGLDFEIPSYGRFILADNKFSISKPLEDKNYSIDYSISPYKGDHWRPYITNMEQQSLPTTAITDQKNKLINYQTLIPSKGIWWLKVSLTEKIKNEYLTSVWFPEVIILKITWL